MISPLVAVDVASRSTLLTAGGALPVVVTIPLLLAWPPQVSTSGLVVAGRIDEVSLWAPASWSRFPIKETARCRQQCR